VAFVVVEKGSKQDMGRRFQLGENVALIGRAAPDNNPDIEIHDDYVSRLHAEISYHQNYFRLRDLGSKNGTEIDRQRIESGKFYPLSHDSYIGLGIDPRGPRVVLRFKESPTTVTVHVQGMDEVSPLSWLKINEERREVWVDGKLVSLSRKEYDLATLLCNRAGTVCSRDEIIAKVWPETKDPGAVSEATIDQLIHRLREKIEPDVSQPKRLISRKGFGYILG
jgi:pSer/pThr/pTyr-binding forkhead associated (FHA) protein